MVSMRGRRSGLVIVALALVSLGLTACLAPPPGSPTAITTETGLFPAFRADVTNYVTRCDPSTPTAVHVSTPDGTLVSVDGNYPRSGVFGVYVTRSVGERFTIALTTDASNDTTTRYNVRCLPPDFPTWSAQPAASGATPFFMTSPLVSGQLAYTAIYDRNGVPLWWGPPQNTTFSTLLPDGNVGSMVNGGLEETTLDGTFVRTVKTVGGPADPHDVLLLPNGHVVMVTIQPEEHVDLTALGGPADASICNHVVQEIDPSDGSVVWDWDTAEHIPVTEMDPHWFAQYIDAGPTVGCGYDVYHWNAIEPTPTGFILSFRHEDAVYQIDRTTGNIDWKLSGSTRPESLTVVGDPVFDGGSHFGGQHDSRLLPDGTITLFDDGSGLARSPRAVRYAIDTTAHTATLLDSVSDPGIQAAFCCGSARYLGSDDWVIGWGSSGVGTETVGATRQTALTFPGAIIYRTIPLTSSQVTTQQLVDAMDVRFATLGATTAPVPSGGVTPFPP